MAEKVRYYLEQTLPELEELQRKGIFTREEITSISRRRTDFEHRINSRGAKLLDFMKYAEYEMNLDLLRKKRIARQTGGDELKGNSVAAWAGQQRIFFVFERATRKYTADLELWRQYIAYARQQKARRLLTKMHKQIVRLLPAQPIVWIWAAEHELRDNANRKAARNLLLRGIKFNPDSKELAEAYQKLEEDVHKALEALQQKETNDQLQEKVEPHADDNAEDQ